MYQKERLDKILEILKEDGYATVKYLTKKLNTSNATINRDLNLLENRKTVTRSYGGVEICEEKWVPLELRYNKERIGKRKIAKAAAEFICDGDVVFIDGSTTSESMGEYLSDKNGITVLTNNMALVSQLSECGISVICTGGYVIEPPNMLAGDDAVKTISRYNFDKVFFTASGVYDNGVITATNTIFYPISDAARANSKESYFLIDHSKINIDGIYNVTDFSEINTVISDYDFPESTKQKYQKTAFYKV